jgi:hypothetical protein
MEEKADRQFVELLDEHKSGHAKMSERVKRIEDVAERTLKLISMGHSGVNLNHHHASHHDGREGLESPPAAPTRRKSTAGLKSGGSGKVSPAGSETAIHKRRSSVQGGVSSSGDAAKKTKKKATSSTTKKSSSSTTTSQRRASVTSEKNPSFVQKIHFRPGGLAGAHSDGTGFNRYLGRQLSVNDL